MKLWIAASTCSPALLSEQHSTASQNWQGLTQRLALKRSSTLCCLPDVSVRLKKILWQGLVDAGSAAAHRGWKPSFEDLSTMMDVLEQFVHRTLNFELGDTAITENSSAHPTKKRGQKAPCRCSAASSKPAELIVRDQHLGSLGGRPFGRDRVGGFDLAELEGFEGFTHAFNVV